MKSTYSIILVIFLFWSHHQTINAQNDDYSVMTLFKWDWNTINDKPFEKLTSNSTYKYFDPTNTHPVLKAFESNFFRKSRTTGNLNVDLQFHGNKTEVLFQDRQYNELRLPAFIIYNTDDLYWNVFRADMELNNAPSTYKMPLQLRFFMRPKSKNKIEISIKNDGTIVFFAQNGKKEENVVFYAGKKIDLSKRFLLEFRFSNKGEFVVYVNNKEHYKKSIPVNFINDGSENGIWFEGKTTLYALNQEEWHTSSGIGKSELYLNLMSSSIANNFENIADLYIGQQLKQSSSSKIAFKKGSFKVDKSLINPYVTFAIRKNLFTDTEGRFKINYKVGIYVFGTVETATNKTESITFPLVYEFDYPDSNHDYSDVFTDPNYKFKFYTKDTKNPEVIYWNELKN